MSLALDKPARLDLATALDAARVLRATGKEPDPWQGSLLRSGAPRTLLLCSRQAGKSTVTAALAVHEALYQAPALILLLSPSLRQSGELFRKCLDCFNALGRPVGVENESALRLELANGSRIESLPGKEETIRGFSGVGLLIADEAARVPDPLYYSIRPMLAVSGGRFIGLTTPFGKRGWFYSEWTEGGPGWQRVRVPARDCSRISAEFLEEERRALGPWWFTQEYECEFVDTTDQVFSSEHVEAALDPALMPLWGEF